MEKTFVCLANSRKVSGRCIAGKESNNNSYGEWIRPISERQHHEISEDDRRYQDGSTAQVLDVVRATLKGHSPHPAQQENYTIDDGYYWEKVGSYSGDFNDLIDTPASLWEVGYSSYNGLNDRVPTADVTTPRQSLYLIEPDELTIIVRVEGAEFGNGKRRVRANFLYNGTRHELSVTDPDAERYYLSQGEGNYEPDEQCLLTVSLGEAWDGYYYKLVAALFEVE